MDHFWFFSLHECLQQRWNFLKIYIIWYGYRIPFPVQAGEQRHHLFQPLRTPPNRFRTMYSSESLSTDCTRLWLFSGRLSNIGIVLIHIHYNIKMYMRTRSPGISKCFIFAHSFYRNYPPLHKTWSDLVLCGLWRPIFLRFLNFPELWFILTKSVTYY